jgi:hypothetical protein
VDAAAAAAAAAAASASVVVVVRRLSSSTGRKETSKSTTTSPRISVRLRHLRGAMAAAAASEQVEEVLMGRTAQGGCLFCLPTDDEGR